MFAKLKKYRLEKRTVRWRENELSQVQRIAISSTKTWRPVTSIVLQKSTLLEQKDWTT